MSSERYNTLDNGEKPMNNVIITITHDFDDDDVDTRTTEITIPEHFLWMWEALIKCILTATAKNHDYSQGQKWYHNFSGGGLKGIVNRMQDKFMRCVNLLNGNEAEVQDESFDDTCLDLATYCLLLYGARKAGLSVEGDLWSKRSDQ